MLNMNNIHTLLEYIVDCGFKNLTIPFEEGTNDACLGVPNFSRKQD